MKQSDEVDEDKIPTRSLRRPKSASAVSSSKIKSKPPPVGLSLDDWNALLEQCANETFRFPYLKKGSKTRTFEQTTAPNHSNYHLNEKLEQEKKENEEFDKKLKKENESKLYYIKKCIDELNELCHDLHYYQYYEFFNDKQIKKYLSKHSFKLRQDGKNPFTSSAHDHHMLDDTTNHVPLSKQNVKVKYISIGKFNREHEEILAKYVALKRSQQRATSPKLHNTTAAAVTNTTATTPGMTTPSLVGGGQSLATGFDGKEGSLFLSTNEHEEMEDRPKQRNPPTPHKSRNYAEDDDFDLDDEFQMDQRQENHNSLNELQKRALIQSVQQQILTDLHEKDLLLLKQIEEIKRRGWNKSLIHS